MPEKVLPGGGRQEGSWKIGGRAEGNSAPASGARFWEVDLLRGLAVLCMVAFHLLFDLDYFQGGYQLTDRDLLLGKASASTFLFLVGLSLSLSCSRARILRGRCPFPRYLARGARIFALGMGITLATWIYPGEGVIIFGILHLIGLSIILACPFLAWPHPARPWICLAAALAVGAMGLHVDRMTVDFPWLLWLGLAPRGFFTLDYFPLLPWFALVLLGLWAGELAYPGYRRRIPLPDLTPGPGARWLVLPGRHPLAIYLVHQPLLIALLDLSGLINITII
ncbi:MAG: DUF1624 domain-containing protein [Methanosarcinales archaeon]|nr:DUF1624 domain-containing protein [Methanosarcinales archaeon]